MRLITSFVPVPTTTAVLEEDDAQRPERFSLEQNYPNPFNSGTAIRFVLPTGGEVDLAVFNLAGQYVANLVDDTYPAGTYTIRWDGRDDEGREVATGLYLYRLQIGARVQTRKLIVLR